MIRRTLSLLPVLIAAGCSCNQDYAFPERNEVTFDAPENFGAWLSLDQAPDGVQIAMAYYDISEGALGFAVGSPQDDGTVVWAHEPVDGYTGDDGLDRSNRGKYASMKVSGDGSVWVAYHDADQGGLYVSQRLGPGNWSEPEKVDTGGGMAPSAGQWASLALDADNNPVIAHHDGGTGTLRMTRFNGTDWTSAEIWAGSDYTSTGDTGEEVTLDANVGTYARLLIHDGTEYVAFYDAAWKTLNLLEGTAGSYTHTVVDDTGDAGQWPSIWTDGTDLRIAYHDVAQQDLVISTRSAGVWTREIVDSGDYRGADTEIFEHGEAFSVLYFDGVNSDQVLATDEGGWTTQTVGGADAAVGFHNEVVQVGGVYWFASYDYTNQTLFIQSDTFLSGT
jgi:hypothetical protein